MSKSLSPYEIEKNWILPLLELMGINTSTVTDFHLQMSVGQFPKLTVTFYLNKEAINFLTLGAGDDK